MHLEHNVFTEDGKINKYNFRYCELKKDLDTCTFRKRKEKKKRDEMKSEQIKTEYFFF